MHISAVALIWKPHLNDTYTYQLYELLNIRQRCIYGIKNSQIVTLLQLKIGLFM